MANQFKVIGDSFVQQYYAWFDDIAQRPMLRNLYNPENAVLNFEGSEVIGVDKIMERLMNLPLGEIKREISTTDAQPTLDGGIFVHVVGRLKTDNDMPNSFTQAFILKPYGNSFFIQNDSFRLVLHNSG